MRHYAALLRLQCFTRADVIALTGSEKAADSLLTSYRKKRLIDLVRRGLWVVLGLGDGQPVASRYRIATGINPDTCVSHHSAFEYHGVANQVYYEIFVSSPRRFAPFTFDSVSYRHIASRVDVGVVEQPDGVRVSDLERTVLDSINDVEKVAGLEELTACLSLIPRLDPDKLLDYLSRYHKQALYQKTGFLLSLYAAQLRLPESFFEICRSHLGKGVSRLGNDSHHSYDRAWRLVIPANLRKK